jgi:2-polyprenyl-6-hydroxyphenyl methylase/3-demethylubiquinone-9 3-methyltransferase
MHQSIRFHDALSNIWEEKYTKRSFQHRAATLLGLIGNNDLTSKTWLDAGCGTGYLSRLLAKQCGSVYAIDASPSMISMANYLRDDDKLIYPIISNLEALPFPESTFDGILCSSVIEYLDRPDICLREFFRVLKKDGQLLLSVPNRNSILRISEKLCFGFTTTVVGYSIPKHLEYLKFSKRSYTQRELCSVLTKVHFKQEKVTFGGTGFMRQADKSKYVGSLIMILSRKTE